MKIPNCVHIVVGALQTHDDDDDDDYRLVELIVNPSHGNMNIILAFSYRPTVTLLLLQYFFQYFSDKVWFNSIAPITVNNVCLLYTSPSPRD